MVNCLVRMRKIKKQIAANMKSFISIMGLPGKQNPKCAPGRGSAFCKQDQKTDAHDARSWGLPGGFLASSVQNALRDGLPHCAGVE